MPDPLMGNRTPMMHPVDDSLPKKSRPYESKRGSEVIALLIMGIGLMVTGFFSGWMYFQIRQGLGPGRGKETIVPAAIGPIALGDDPLILAGPENLSWKMNKGSVVLELNRHEQPLQTVRFVLDPKEVGAKLLWLRQKISAEEELWTIALGLPQSGKPPRRETIRVLLDANQMGLLARGGPVPLQATAQVLLTRWENKTDAKGKPGFLKSVQMTWHP